ncbi:bifunctional 3'-5' exonuclease/DNA polymerase [Sinomonas cellulolyticus]|uniref:DNA-directed DNA polymerase n=1 Tax=Sinomonas cellulolyticus TaxID=2801916 RepID=A0ABS1K453_9MICC|nr:MULTISPECIES: bifunctional 3'-5' exonuclease/DNA polymerase [Sinomonas]MBL0705687.1 bifunctional 3'-5' exonuclease/DNA polymerase [Sinomonas cellulolyticus]
MYELVAPAPGGAALIRRLGRTGRPTGDTECVAQAELPEAVRRIEQRHGPRWVWERTAEVYPALLTAGVEVDRCHDLSLSAAILASSAFVSPAYTPRIGLPGSTDPDAEPAGVLAPGPLSPFQGTLFEPAAARGPGIDELEDELQSQLAAVARSPAASRLRLLLAAESAGALIAIEMQQAGMPWDAAVHDALLTARLGPRPSPGARPALLEAKAGELRTLLGAPRLNPDSPRELMQALHRAGVEARTTRAWELRQFRHPAITPLLEYKKMARLLSANGWAWIDAWVRDGRFRPEYVVGGVVTGRWASRGGGALQIPAEVRSAARALPGHRLVVADAAQLEPRVLAALAGDGAMAEAARGQDLYAGIAASGFGGDRTQAKVALLGAIYGATTGESGRLMPQLTRMYPRAVALVEQAARDGERGLTVTTHLGRSTPAPSARWRASQRTTTAEEQRRGDAVARDRGRFTRNFIVQGTAAEWAECWMADLRGRLRRIRRQGLTAELVYFLHDEVVIHAEEAAAEACAAAAREAARAAGRLLFPGVPVEFPLTVAVVRSYDQAK